MGLILSKRGSKLEWGGFLPPPCCSARTGRVVVEVVVAGARCRWVGVANFWWGSPVAAKTFWSLTEGAVSLLLRVHCSDTMHRIEWSSVNLYLEWGFPATPTCTTNAVPGGSGQYPSLRLHRMGVHIGRSLLMWLDIILGLFASHLCPPRQARNSSRGRTFRQFEYVFMWDTPRTSLQFLSRWTNFRTMMCIASGI